MCALITEQLHCVARYSCRTRRSCMPLPTPSHPFLAWYCHRSECLIHSRSRPAIRLTLIRGKDLSSPCALPVTSQPFDTQTCQGKSLCALPFTSQPFDTDTSFPGQVYLLRKTSSYLPLFAGCGALTLLAGLYFHAVASVQPARELLALSDSKRTQ